MGVLARSGVIFMEVGLVVQIVAPFSLMFFHGFVPLGQFPTPHALEGVLVLLLHMVALDADMLGSVDLLIELGDGAGL